MEHSWSLIVIGLYWQWTKLGPEKQRIVSKWFWAIIVYGGIIGTILSLLMGKPLSFDSGYEGP